jgi:hypothetical protein
MPPGPERRPGPKGNGSLPIVQRSQQSGSSFRPRNPSAEGQEGGMQWNSWAIQPIKTRVDDPNILFKTVIIFETNLA